MKILSTPFRANVLLVAVVFLGVVFFSGCGDDTTQIIQTQPNITEIATEAYIYGYAPIQVMASTHNQTNSTTDPVYAPINKLYIDTQTATPESALFVTPNVNVLYSSSHLDLTTEPLVLYTPSIQDRYFSWQIMDAYTNAFHYIGTRGTGGVEGTYAIVGPNWQGTLPEEYSRIDSPTNSVWLVGRHEVDPQDVNPDDINTVIALVQASVLLPMSEFIVKDPGYVNPIIPHPSETVEKLNITGLNFYALLNQWLTMNPPPAADDAAMQEFAKIGIGPGFTTDFSALPQSNQTKYLAAETIATGIILLDTVYAATQFLNGWGYNLGPQYANWGTDYLIRASVARGALGMNINEEAIYPLATSGPDGLPLKGNHSYTLTLTAADLPVPVNEKGFWSLTMYDRETFSLVANPINRYSIGSQNDLHYASDGSVTIYIQRDDPGGNQTKNWLPSPQNNDKFYMLFRAYYPDPEMYTPADNPPWIVPRLEKSGL